jgi:hypothetical protein
MRLEWRMAQQTAIVIWERRESAFVDRLGHRQRHRDAPLAHGQCFIANSVRSEIRFEPVIESRAPATALQGAAR